VDDAVEVDEALLPVALVLLDVRAELAVPVAVDAEFVLVGPAVTVTGKNVISDWARVDDDVPGKLAPVPLIISVQMAVVVPPMEQTTRPQLSVIVSLSHILRGTEEGEKTYNPSSGSLIAHSMVLGAEVYHMPGPIPQSELSVPGGQLML
jgi:hypothetical protein